MAIYRERGIVLRTIKLGEADKIVTIATEGRGKVRAVAKGVRKTKSRFGARLEPLSHVALLLYEGRQLDTITQVETIDAFRAVREDLDRLTQATVLLEAVDHMGQEGEDNPRLLQMLLGALRTLEAGPAPLVVPAFFWKLLAQEGFHPLLDECASCGERADVPGVGGVPQFTAFDLEVGGVLCRSCAQSAPRLSAAGLALLRRMLGGDLVAVLAEPASAAGYEVEHLATRALEAHVERRMRSMHMLDRN
ncbi:MAG: repair protein RecO [Actinomycetota bacterium]|jgi:DNA repair protein RecO (recombination protein O)|nr:repair protein RecO [Actinomycetota bacterium]